MTFEFDSRCVFRYHRRHQTQRGVFSALGFFKKLFKAALVRLKAPPVEGAANEALIEFLSYTFKRPRRAIALLSGEKSRDKRISIEGLTDAEFTARLSDILNTLPDE